MKAKKLPSKRLAEKTGSEVAPEVAGEFGDGKASVGRQVEGRFPAIVPAIIWTLASEPKVGDGMRRFVRDMTEHIAGPLFNQAVEGQPLKALTLVGGGEKTVHPVGFALLDEL